MADESFRDKWRARPVGNTTAGTIADACIRKMERDLRSPELPASKRSNLEHVIEKINNDDVKSVQGCIDAYYLGIVDIRGVR